MLGASQVKNHGFFSCIEPDKITALACDRAVITPSKVTFWSFNFDDLCTGLG